MITGIVLFVVVVTFATLAGSDGNSTTGTISI